MKVLCARTTVILTITICLIHQSLAEDQSNDLLFGNVVEDFLKDVFKKEMNTVNTNNMTDCMTRLLCENICTRTANGQITEPLLDSKEIMGKDPSLPKNLDYFFAGGDRGFEFGQNKQCHQCAIVYKNCESNQYDYAKDLTDKYPLN